jgi:hypothetical protein
MMSNLKSYMTDIKLAQSVGSTADEIKRFRSLGIIKSDDTAIKDIVTYYRKKASDAECKLSFAKNPDPGY